MIRLANHSEDTEDSIILNLFTSIFNIIRSGADKFHFQLNTLPYFIKEIFLIILDVQFHMRSLCE